MTNGMIQQLTLDTNLLFEYWNQREKRKVVECLAELAVSGEVDLAVSARIREDVPRDPLASKLNEVHLPGIVETASVARVGFWVIGRDMIGADGFEDRHIEAWQLAKQRGVKKPPDWRDWDHPHSHFLQGRNYFLTWDRGILCLAHELEKWFGIVVLKPEAELEKIDERKGLIA